MNYWTDEEVAILRQNYGKIPRAKLREILTRSSSSMTKKAKKLGLVSAKVYLEPIEADQRRSNLRKRNYQASSKRDARVQMLTDAKRRAKAKNLEFSITLDDVMILDVCPIYGIPLFRGPGYPIHNSPSLDRKDSTKGYIKGNVWIISNKANRIKNDASVEDLEILWRAVKKVLEPSVL